MKTDDIINVNYTTEKDNMLIPAHMDVMKNTKNHIFINHLSSIIGLFLIFSSINNNFGRGTPNKLHK